MHIRLSIFLLSLCCFMAAQPFNPGEIGANYLRNASGMDKEDLAGIYVVKEYRTEHNGVTHLVYRQQFDGVDVHGGEWTVNVDQNGTVVSAGGRFFRRPSRELRAPESSEGASAAAAAVREVNPSLKSTSFLPSSAALPKGEKYMKFSRGGLGGEIEGKAAWYAIGEVLRPVWIFYVPGENGSDRFATIVDATSHQVIRSDNLTKYQSAQTPRGLVFERTSPQPNPRPGTLVPSPRPYVQRTLQSFAGDLLASPKGWVYGTETIGNNVTAGYNNLGVSQLRNPEPAVAPDRNFSFPLELGPNAPSPTLFKYASITNLFYWTNKAHDMFWHAGFNEAAGNYQQDNLNRGGVGGDPILAFSQFGIAAPGETELDNSFFTTNREFEDGSLASVNMFLGGNTGGGVFADGSYDAEVILHEYTHGVSARLMRQIGNFQGRSMGEAWSDFFGLEFTVPEGSPADGSYPFGEYLFQALGPGIRTRPYSTDMNVNPLTFEQLGRVIAFGPEVHADGEIWASALWEARANLIRQFGETEGRRRIRMLVIDGMKLSPPAATMVSARDAILLADRLDFKGESQDQLWSAFAKRGLGVLAQSSSADSTHISASFDKPSNQGTLQFYERVYNLGETVRLALHDANNTNSTALVQVTSSSGDVESIVLRKQGEVYLGEIQTFTDGYVVSGDSAFDLTPGDYVSAYYVDADSGSGPKLIQTTVPTETEYVMTDQRAASSFLSGSERPLFPATPGRTFFGTSQRVELPFVFPFFGKSYKTVHVSANGVLGFDLPVTRTCNTQESLAATTGVAPMWLELAYGGAAQTNENVFISSGPGSVTIRWAAETLQTGEPVNFSAVLYDDGRIMFQYGNGNNNLVNTSVLGCTANAPVVGLSAGTETYTLRHPFYDGAPYLERAPSVVIDPPFNHSSDPVLQIESPESNSIQRGVVTVRGIAYDANGSVPRLDIVIDGRPRVAITPEISRADFCATQAVRGCPFVGFQFQLDLKTFGILPGQHTLQIRALNNRGSFKTFPDTPITFTVEPGQSREPVGVIEFPASGATISATTPIRGYAYASDLRITAVDIIIDGVTYGRAIYGQRRDDICGSLTPRPPNCPAIGFTFSLNSASGAIQLPNGTHTLQIRPIDESGRSTLIPEQPFTIVVDNPPNADPVGVLSSPAPNARVSGVINVSGYGYDPDGTIRTVTLVVDGGSYGTLRYGTDRTAECASLPDLAACPNIGFEGDFDTTRLSNGLHSLAIQITDDKGRSRLIPVTTRRGINIFVQN